MTNANQTGLERLVYRVADILGLSEALATLNEALADKADADNVVDLTTNGQVVNVTKSFNVTTIFRSVQQIYPRATVVNNPTGGSFFYLCR